MIAGLFIIALATAVYAMLAHRLSQAGISAPMVFLALGYALSMTGLLPHAGAERVLHLFAEIALVVVLFLDAAQTDLTALRRRHEWPVRMLALGMPLMVGLGTVAIYFIMPDMPLLTAALIAALLAPTDAALGRAVVTNPVVPERVRRALTVESGLNDGLALPAVLLFASLVAELDAGGQSGWLLFAAEQLALGPLAGMAVGIAGGKALLFVVDRSWTRDAFEGLATLALAGTAYLAADLIGGNRFIAAFVAGLCFGNVVKGRCKFVYEFTEGEGQLVAWGAFFLMGLAVMPAALTQLSLPMFAVIALSLFVLRPLAIWLSLLGSDAAYITRLFFGWFGPRGLATALFALIVLGRIDADLVSPVVALAMNAVWMSALLHGISAEPGARLYARRLKAIRSEAEDRELEDTARRLVTIGPKEHRIERRPPDGSAEKPHDP